jgi:hypothetical protein
MNVASLELCKELYELSGWEQIGKEYPGTEDGVPYYTLGYLLRKLPKPDFLDQDMMFDKFDGENVDYLFLGYGTGMNWTCQYQEEERPIDGLMGEADTPEDAACRLAIHLFDQGF